MDKKNIFFSAVSSILFMKVVSFTVGYLQSFFMLQRYGAGYLVDAWCVVALIPDVLLKFLLLGALGVSFLPIFIECLSRHGQDEAWHIASPLISIVALVCIVVVFTGELYAPYIIHFISPGLKGAAYSVAVTILRIIFIAIFFLGVNSCFDVLCRAYLHFTLPAVLSVLPPLCSVILFLTVPTLGIYALPWGMVVGHVISFFAYVIFFYKKRVPYRWSLDMRHYLLKETGRLMRPLIGAEIIGKAVGLVDRFFASFLVSGSISIFYLAQKISLLPIQLFSLSVAQVSFPLFSYDIASQRGDDFKKGFVWTIKISLLTVVPVMAILVSFGKDILWSLFGYGKFSLSDSACTYKIILALFLAIFCSAVRPIFVRVLYSLRKNSLLLKVEMVTFIINAVFDWWLMYYWGIYGIAMASSIVVGVSTLYIAFLIPREILGSILTRDMGWFIGKLIIASMAMILVGVGVRSLLGDFLFYATLWSRIFYLGGLVSICGIIFFLCLTVVRTKELKTVWDVARGYFGKNKLSL